MNTPPPSLLPVFFLFAGLGLATLILLKYGMPLLGRRCYQCRKRPTQPVAAVEPGTRLRMQRALEVAGLQDLITSAMLCPHCDTIQPTQGDNSLISCPFCRLLLSWDDVQRPAAAPEQHLYCRRCATAFVPRAIEGFTVFAPVSCPPAPPDTAM